MQRTAARRLANQSLDISCDQAAGAQLARIKNPRVQRMVRNLALEQSD